MGVKWKTVKNKTPKMYAPLKGLNGKKVNAGVLEGGHAWLARIYEYGCTLYPKNAEYVTVPLVPEAVGLNAGDFPGLFVYTGHKGEKFLARKNQEGELELVYWMAQRVKIPERSFLRTGFDENHKSVLKFIDRLLPLLAEGRINERDLLLAAGETLAAEIKAYAKNTDIPSNANTAAEQKGSDNPLDDFGGLIESISYEVE